VIQILIYAMVYLGSALMVYNIFCFIQFVRYIREMKVWDGKSSFLYVPIFLLVFFLLGYLSIGLFGHPSPIMAGVLFGGSIFVQIMYCLLNYIVHKVIESEQLKTELLAAEASSRAKSSFLASISHEMRTPVNVILGMDALVLKNPGVPAEVREQLEKIGFSARHLSELIDNLLDLQESAQGSSSAKGEPVPLQEAIGQINAVYSFSCGEKGLIYQSSLDDELIRSYTGDAAQLKRALMNILDNAVKFTDAPGTVQFTVEGDEAGSESAVVRFVISDTGIGMEEDFLPKVFEAFIKEDDSTTSRFGGSGVGLTAAFHIISAMGGRIEAQSRKNEGSTFTVTIPMITSPMQEWAQAPEAQADPADDLEGRRILIVDDIEENAEIVADLLEIAGAESDCAQNGQIALDLFAQSGVGEYDAILMDLRMPVMDGLEATRRIRALERADAKSVPIIALSANAYDSDVQNSLKAGMNSHLAKPAASDLLYRELSKWIRRSIREEAADRHDRDKTDRTAEADSDC